MRFIPKIFHPEWFQDKEQFFLRDDRRCFNLANEFRTFLKQLQSVDTNSQLVELFKSQFGHKIAKILHSLENRIARYQYNAEHREFYLLADESEAKLQEIQAPFKNVERYEMQLGKYNELQTSIKAIGEKLPDFSPMMNSMVASLEQNSENLKNIQGEYKEASNKLNDSDKSELKPHLGRFASFYLKTHPPTKNQNQSSQLQSELYIKRWTRPLPCWKQFICKKTLNVHVFYVMTRALSFLFNRTQLKPRTSHYCKSISLKILKRQWKNIVVRQAKRMLDKLTYFPELAQVQIVFLSALNPV